MAVRKERLVHAHRDGVDYTFVRASRITPHWPGGPLEWDVTGIEHGPRRLHAIGRLSGRAIPALSRHYLSDIPLVYGICFDGCDMAYRLTEAQQVEVLRMSTTRSSDDWPYRDLPAPLPFVPLILATAVPRSYADFAQRFPNLPDRPRGSSASACPLRPRSACRSGARAISRA